MLPKLKIYDKFDWVKTQNNMKKVLLGLILSVGMSGICMANTIDLNTNNQEVILSCFHGYKTSSIDCKGNITNIYLGGHSSACSSYEPDGTIIMHILPLINACDAGPLKDFTKAIETFEEIVF